jgi:hypothetical protein
MRHLRLSGPRDGPGAVRELRLARRRSRLRWVFLVYEVRRRFTRADALLQSESGEKESGLGLSVAEGAEERHPIP